MEKEELQAIIAQQIRDNVGKNTTWRDIQMSSEYDFLIVYVIANGGDEHDLYEAYVNVRKAKTA